MLFVKHGMYVFPTERTQVLYFLFHPGKHAIKLEDFIVIEYGRSTIKR